MKTVWKVLIIVGSLLAAGFLFLAVLGFTAYRNFFPSADKIEAAATVGKFNLKRTFPVKGNLWGTETDYLLEYETENAGKKEAITYLLHKFSSESAAISDFSRETCSRKDLTKEGVIKDRSGSPVGDFKYCGGTLHFRNKSRAATVYTFVLGSTDTASDDTVIDFVKSLSFNSDVDFSSFAPAYPSIKTESPTSSSTLPLKSDGDVLSAFELAKKQRDSKESVSQYNGREITVRGYIWTPPATPEQNKMPQGLTTLSAREETYPSISCWYEKSEAKDFKNLQGKQYITVKGIFDGKYSPELKNCKLVSAE